MLLHQWYPIIYQRNYLHHLKVLCRQDQLKNDWRLLLRRDSITYTPLPTLIQLVWLRLRRPLPYRLHLLCQIQKITRVA